MLLEPIYEQEFKEFSFGFRPGRSAHDALEYLWKQCMDNRVRWLSCNFSGGKVVFLWHWAQMLSQQTVKLDREFAHDAVRASLLGLPASSSRW